MALIKCKCGCGELREAVDSQGRPREYIVGHSIKIDPITRFWSHVNKSSGVFGKNNDSTECWLWTASINNKGYGNFKPSKSESYKAHRFSYKIVHGLIEPGYEIHHKCKIKKCVKPEHLTLVTREEHALLEDPGIFNTSKTHCPHGHEYNEINTGHSHGRQGRLQRYCRACNRKRYYKDKDMSILVLGDTHGKYQLEHSIIQKVISQNPNVKAIFHCGDWGYGWPTKNGPHIWDYPFKPNFYVTLGNHDPYSYYKKIKLPSWLHIQERGDILEIHGKRTLWCGGGYSIDRKFRTLNQTYWLEETIKQEDLDKCLAQEGPIDLLITHETAENYPLKAKRPEFTEGKSDRIAVQAIVDKFKPKYHTFGHWHSPDNGNYIHKDGSITKWACMPEVDSGHFAIWDGENLQLSWLDGR